MTGHIKTGWIKYCQGQSAGSMRERAEREILSEMSHECLTDGLWGIQKRKEKHLHSTSVTEPSALSAVSEWNTASVWFKEQPPNVTVSYHAGHRVTLVLATSRAHEYMSASLMMVEVVEEWERLRVFMSGTPADSMFMKTSGFLQLLDLMMHYLQGNITV